jgi:hypothetical protein
MDKRLVPAKQIKVQQDKYRITGVLMITQKFKNGTSEIRIESAESLQDAQENNFPNGSYSRYFINGKQADSYAAVVNHIVSSSASGGSFKMPSIQELQKLQEDILMNQKIDMLNQIEKIKQSYAGFDVPKECLDQLDAMAKSIDLSGVRVKA